MYMYIHTDYQLSSRVCISSYHFLISHRPARREGVFFLFFLFFVMATVVVILITYILSVVICMSTSRDDNGHACVTTDGPADRRLSFSMQEQGQIGVGAKWCCLLLQVATTKQGRLK
ncbi:hypothetical protein K504DRAFT_151630 [Pleomassaria siparia CBS 279.74]|uniref:Uncharacterized protein n=1 Tax=Pleomassaria siparia CBS 279.74 TaxID=1314801 RepID=A0A6G1KM88_9PLEO|nr:hypothetical protein K504DRAFT_151630 [Pleomassaria siparia CBS 279.74]